MAAMARDVAAPIPRVPPVTSAVRPDSGRSELMRSPCFLCQNPDTCLELLDQHPGLSNAALARDAFVTRQSMNVVLRNLEAAGLLSRPASSDHGRALPAHLTAAGAARLDAARDAVFAVQRRLIEAVPPQRRATLLADLDGMAAALGG